MRAYPLPARHWSGTEEDRIVGKVSEEGVAHPLLVGRAREGPLGIRQGGALRLGARVGGRRRLRRRRRPRGGLSAEARHGAEQGGEASRPGTLHDQHVDLLSGA